MWGNCVSYTPGKLGRSPCVLYNRVGLGEQWLRRAEVGLGTLGPEARLGNAAGTSLRQWRLVKGAGSAVGGLGPTACPLPTGLRGTRSWRPPGRGASLRDTSLLAVRQVCHQWYTYNMHVCVCVCVCVHPLSHSVVSNSSVTPWTLLARLLHPWDFPGRNTGVGCHFLLQRIFPTQGSSLGLLYWQAGFLPSEPPGKLICVRVRVLVCEIHTYMHIHTYTWN